MIPLRYDGKIIAVFDSDKVREWMELDSYDASPDGLSGNKEGFYFANWLVPFRPTFTFNGQVFSPTCYPACLEKKMFSCAACQFFKSKDCPIKKDKSNFALTREGFKIYKMVVFSPRGKYPKIFDAAYTEMLLHGRPLHYQIFSKILNSNYPRLKITERKLLSVLKANPLFFLDLGEGVFQVIQGIVPKEYSITSVAAWYLLFGGRPV